MSREPFFHYTNMKDFLSRMDRVRNEEVRRRAGIEMELASTADQRVLRWFGHVEEWMITVWPEGC